MTENNLPDTECLIEESNLPDNEHPVEGRNLPDYDIRNEQLPVFSDMSESDEEMSGTGSGEPEEEREDETVAMETASKEETEEQTGTDIPVRRSERNRQPSRRLDYAELGNPFVTVVKSFFHGLTIAVADILSEGESSWYSPVLSPKIITVQPFPCTGTYMSSGGESVAQA